MNAPSMYESAMGARFHHLPAAVQRFHRLRGHHVLQGWVETVAPASLPARWLGRLLGTPLQAASGSITFELDAAPGQERWTRHFPQRTMRSQLRLVGEELVEELSPARLTFALAVEAGALSMRLSRMRFLGIPCPRWLLPALVARERGDGDTLHFQISAALPLIGVVAQYQGHLVLKDAT